MILPTACVKTCTDSDCTSFISHYHRFVISKLPLDDASSTRSDKHSTVRIVSPNGWGPSGNTDKKLVRQDQENNAVHGNVLMIGDGAEGYAASQLGEGEVGSPSSPEVQLRVKLEALQPFDEEHSIPQESAHKNVLVSEQQDFSATHVYNGTANDETWKLERVGVWHRVCNLVFADMFS